MITNIALQYHDTSSYDRHRMSGHSLDWANQPDVYKHYPIEESILLSREVRPPGITLSSILRQEERESIHRPLDLEDLSLILYLTNTLTARAHYQEGDFYYRSAASAGALYPTEIYVATHGLAGLDDGLYYFSIKYHHLVPLRRQDLSSVLQKNDRAPGRPAPSLTFFFSSIFFRSAWKYRERAYRYHLMDTGHVLENMVLALRGLDLPFLPSYDFNDHEVNKLIGLDEKREVALAMIHVFGKEESPSPGGGDLLDLPAEILEASRVSAKEVDFPLIREMHLAGMTGLSGPSRDPGMLQDIGPVPVTRQRIESPTAWPETLDYGEALVHRRSRRNFIKAALPTEAVMSILESLCIAEKREGDDDRTISISLLVGNVEGMEPGFYLLDRERIHFGMAKQGDFTGRMAEICLDQMWFSHAGLQVLFIANLDAVETCFGSRGYRYALVNAGRLGQRVYLMATALGLGCCGVAAFYDWEASKLLGLNAASRLLYLVGVGKVKGER